MEKVGADMDKRRRAGRAGVAWLAIVLVATVVAACSGSDDPGTASGDGGVGHGDGGATSAGGGGNGGGGTVVSGDDGDGDDGDDAGDAASSSESGATDTGSTCTKNSDCPSSVCLPVGAGGGGPDVCTSACASDSDCTPGWSCGALLGHAGNVCKCTAGTESCNGKDDDCNGVVDDEPGVDQGCSASGPPEVCKAGACSCVEACGGSACIDLTSDVQHCGSCSTPCVAGQSCSGGACACPGGQAACKGACIDVTHDGDNCGACGVSCGSAGACDLGTCSCVQGATMCSGACVELQSDARNCGACGKSCGSGSCAAGACVCPQGSELCNGTCVNVTSDPNNCGACGTTCASCTAGVCAALISTGEGTPNGLATDGTTLYWTTPTGVFSMARTGGAITTLASPSGTDTPGDITYDKGTVYYADNRADGTASILSRPAGGGSPTTWAVASAFVNFVRVSSSGEVFWTTGAEVHGQTAPTSTVGTVLVAGELKAYGLDVSGTTHWAIVDGELENIDTHAVYENTAFLYSLVVADGATAYFNDASDIGRYTLSIGYAPVANDESGLALMVLASGNVYWTNEVAGTVKKTVGIGGGGVETTIASGQAGPTYLVATGGSVYWINKQTGNILQAPW